MKRFEKLFSLRSDSFTSAIYVGSSAIIGLILVSVSLRYVGAEIYGLWVLLQAALFIGMMSEQGLGLAIIRLVSNDRSRKDLDLVITSFVPAFIVSIVFLCIIIGINPIFLSYTPQFFNDIVGSAYILPALGITTGFMIFGVIPCAVLTGMKKLYLVNLIKTVARIAQVCSAITLFYFSYSLWSLVISLFIYQFLIFLLSAFMLAKNFNFNFKLNISVSYQSAILKEIWSIGSKIILGRIIGIFIDPLFKFSLGSFIGLTYVTFYDIAFRIVSLISQVPIVALKGRMASYKELIRVKHGLKVKKNMRLADIGIGLYLFIAVLMLYVGLDLFLRLWLSASYDPSIGMTVIFLLPPLFFYIFAHSRELFLISLGDAKTSLKAYMIHGFLLVFSIGILYFNSQLMSYSTLIVCYGVTHMMASCFIFRNYSIYLKSMDLKN